jgi:hypothetical protein
VAVRRRGRAFALVFPAGDFLKIRHGRGDQFRRCAFTNYCEGLDQKRKQVTCKLWDRVERDAPGVTRSADGRAV